MKKRFRILVLIMMCCATISLSLGVFSLVKHFSRPSDAAEETSIDPVKIYSASDFINFVNGSTLNSGDRYGKIMNDIDGVDVSLLKSSDMYHNPTSIPNYIELNGNNKRITYYCSIEDPEVRRDFAVGLFGWVRRIKVEDLIVCGEVWLDINSDNGVTGVGGLVGGVVTRADIINCHVTTEIYYKESSSYGPSPFVGGLVGSSSGWSPGCVAAGIEITNTACFGAVTLEGRVSTQNFSNYAGGGITTEPQNLLAANSYCDYVVNGSLRQSNIDNVSLGFSNAYKNYHQFTNTSLENKYVKGVWNDYFEADNKGFAYYEQYDPYNVYGTNPNIYWLMMRDKTDAHQLCGVYTFYDKNDQHIETINHDDLGWVADPTLSKWSSWGLDTSTGKVYSVNFGLKDTVGNNKINTDIFELIHQEIEITGQLVLLKLTFRWIRYIVNPVSILVKGEEVSPTAYVSAPHPIGLPLGSIYAGKREDVKLTCDYDYQNKTTTITIKIGNDSIVWVINSLMYTVDKYGQYWYDTGSNDGMGVFDYIDLWFPKKVPDIKMRNGVVTLENVKPLVVLKKYNTEFN